MEISDIRFLNALNARFYALFADSFSRTRERPWQGWERLVPALSEAGAKAAVCGGEARVVDVGAGNGRFERFLAAAVPEVPWHFTALDFCAEAPFSGPDVQTARITCDVAETLLAEHALPPADCSAAVTVAFGLMHHMPGEELRRALLGELLRITAPGGLCAVSFWQFLDDEDLSARARACTERALAYLAGEGTAPSLEEGDALLGWQDASPADGAIRFCHHFVDEEIDAMIAFAAEKGAYVRERFNADGRNGRMNAYVVFEMR